MKSPKVLYHFLGSALITMALPISSLAQSKSAAGHETDVNQRIISACDIHFRNSRLEISALTKRVIKLLDCNAKGMTLDPDTGNCINLPAGPAHSWSGTVLKFVDAYGNLTEGQDLKGPQGDPGTNVQCYPVAEGGASSSSGASSSGSSGGDSSSGSSSSSSGGDDSSSSGASSTSSSSSGADSTTSSGSGTSSAGSHGCPSAYIHWDTVSSYDADCGASVGALSEGQSTKLSISYCDTFSDYYVDGSVTVTCQNGTHMLSNKKCKITCFLPDVLITMADGSLKPIHELQVGDVVLGRQGYNTVLATANYDAHTPIYSINGSKAFVTGGHPFWTQDGWKAIDPSLTPTERHNVTTKRLQVGDRLTLADGSEVTVTSIDTDGLAKREHVYSPTVSGDNTYFANGFLVHNKYPGGCSGKVDIPRAN